MTRIRETQPIEQGFARRRREARVRDLDANELIPEGAEVVADGTQLQDWTEIIPEPKAVPAPSSPSAPSAFAPPIITPEGK